ILGGFSISGISGNKTTATWGNKTDYWVIKTDSLGNKLWEKDIGGTEYDLMYTLLTTHDGGFLLGGTSGSPVSGNKSDPIWDTTGVQMRDLWIVRLDSAGNQLWDKDYGGMGNEWVNSIKETYDGGFILASDTWSDVTGNKT